MFDCHDMTASYVMYIVAMLCFLYNCMYTYCIMYWRVRVNVAVQAYCGDIYVARESAGRAALSSVTSESRVERSTRPRQSNSVRERDEKLK